MPDTPYIPAQVPVLSQRGGHLASASWLLYQQQQDQRLSRLEAKGSEHIFGTNLDRLALVPDVFPRGTLMIETDRCCLVYGAGVTVPDRWSYVAGTWSVPFAQAPTDLGLYDEGLLLNVTDFGHVLRWDGAGWTWGPGDSGNGYYVTRPAASAPSGPGWQLCNGAATTYLALAGPLLALVAFVTPVVANQYFRR